MTLSFNDYITAFNQTQHLASLSQFGRGIEREALRVLPEGKLSESTHIKALGSALTHDNITTDYAETLLEFITPVSNQPEIAIAQLEDIQKFTLSKLNNEILWPMSMPCFVDNEDKITIAQYGQSNIGKMKSVYRQGLKNRYGSMMQVIAGIHFNFSFPEKFWQSLQLIEKNQDTLSEFISAKYFALLRNYKRFCWLIPYLYGSSPAICSSFLQNKQTHLPFKKTNQGALYLEYATSLRMSDLGYTNSEQSSLQICYNNVADYIKGVRKAINLPSEKFAEIGINVNGNYQQLNSNILQIENELYAPVRPKCVAKSGEKPSEALANRGVEYIEVRALDINPFSTTGISLEQVHFLDIFLTYCMLEPSAPLQCDEQRQSESNMNAVVERGRDPTLQIIDEGQRKTIKQWGNEIMDKLQQVAQLLDKAHDSDVYQQALTTEKQKINDVSLTPSAQILKAIVEEKQSLTDMALHNATEYKNQLLSQKYQYYNEQYFENSVVNSLAKQRDIEKSDELSFDEFLKDYFNQ